MERALMRVRRVAAGIVLLFVTQFGMAQGATSKADVEKRVDSILDKMTLEEKIEMIGGINDFYTRPIPRLGIPSLRMSDGPMGVHDYGLTTAYPAGIALAASVVATTPGASKSATQAKTAVVAKDGAAY